MFNISLNSIQEQIDSIETQIEETGTNEELENTLEELNAEKEKLETAIKELKANKQEIETSLATAKKELDATKKQLDSAYKKIQAGYKKIESSTSKVDAQEKEANFEFEEAEAEIKEAKAELEDAKTELQEQKETFEKEITEANEKIEEAREEINDIKLAEWYIYTREDDTGYSSFVESIDSINNIAKAFPMVFYIIAVLISLTSMTRMVEEERIEIGTLKALGYNNARIIIKYILYSFTACIIGGALGMIIGELFLPPLVWKMYSILYYLPEFKVNLNYLYGDIGIGIAIICIVGATVQSAYKELKDMPSVLMRGKPPKSGKRVILEYISFIWKRLSFSSKTTIRNLFRYKKRVIMTIIGISGCSALILAGFGLKDSITDIADLQFGRVFHYDLSIVMKKEDENVTQKLSENEDISNYIELEGITVTAEFGDNKKDTNVLIFEDKDKFSNIVSLYDKSTGNIIGLDDNSIIISDKLSEILQVEVNDKITLTDSDNIKHEYIIGGIVENYISHYIYMSKELYENTTQNEYSYNMIFAQYSQDAQKQEELLEELLGKSSVVSITKIDDTLNQVRELLRSLNLVVVVLIVSSALLAFVVLYNLANVNISERIREIATLKVLGFYDKEVDKYINRESMILTVLGILLGMIFGYFLTNYIIGTCEVENMRFARHIAINSYIYSVLITLAFSVIVNKVTHFVLKKVDMVESLKSIE